MRYIFVDAGAYNGCTMTDFINSELYQLANWEIHVFEPHPELFLEIPKHDEIKYYQKGVWSQDCTKDFYIPEKPNQSSSLVKEKRTGFLNKNAPIKVDCIDFSNWLKNNVTREDFVIVKMDIEGTEYNVLNKILVDRTHRLINVLLIEYHHHKMENKEQWLQRHLWIKNTIKKKIKLVIEERERNKKSKSWAEYLYQYHLSEVINFSVLQNLKPEMIKLEPFPHVLIRDTLPEKIYQKLEESYPSTREICDIQLDETYQIQSNKRYQIRAELALSNDSPLSHLWKEFVKYHTSDAFVNEFVKMFKEIIINKHPQLEKYDFSKITHGIRPYKNFNLLRTKDLMLDCQVGVNSPVDQISSVRGPHLDSRNELFACLFYLRDKNDHSHGGKLELYQAKQEEDIKEQNVQKIDPNVVTKIDEISYQRNTSVLFINCLEAIHGVSQRETTSYPRRLVNIIGEMYGHSFY